MEVVGVLQNQVNDDPLLEESVTLFKLSSLSGSVPLVGSKSLTNRALLLSALAQGRTVLHNVLRSDDSKVMLDALVQLGVKIEFIDSTTVAIEGLGSTFKHDPSTPIELFLGNAGTAMRPLCAALALSQGCYKLTGEERMYERPIGVLANALRELGAKITYLDKIGYPPLLIESNQLSTSDSLSIDIAGNTSSQFISAILMVGSLLPVPLTINIKGDLISKPYVDLTCAMLKSFGVNVEQEGYSRFKLKPCALKSPGDYMVEGDASGASYFLAGAAISGDVTVRGIGYESIQGDAKFIDILEQMGAKVERGDHYLKVASQGKLKGISIDMNDMPDAAMTLVPMALYTNGPITITNIESWRVKECDRIEAMATEMRKTGCHVETGADYIIVDSNTPECEEMRRFGIMPVFDTYKDHRMAMALSLVSLDRSIVINDPYCCTKTFPDYFKRFAELANS